MDERTDEHMDGISPHSTGLLPLAGPLPKKGEGGSNTSNSEEGGGG